jgi:hypothetical protein
MWRGSHRESSIEFSGEDLSLVVLGVACAKDESDRTMTRPFREPVERSRRACGRELLAVASLKFWPTNRIVAEPFAKRRARTEVSSPGIEPEVFFRASARPDSIYQDTVAIGRGWLVVCPLQANGTTKRVSHEILIGSGVTTGNI